MKNLLTLDYIYYLIGIILVFVSYQIVKDPNHPRRIGAAAFWFLYAVTFLFGKQIPSLYVGILVLVMVALAALGQVVPGKGREIPREERMRAADRFGNRLFLPALCIPVVTILANWLLPKIHIGATSLIDTKNATLIALGTASVVALLVGLAMTRANLSTPMAEGSRLLQAIGWAAILPQMLSALGALFNAAGVGKVVSELVTSVVPTQNAFVCVAAYAVGMAVFTMIMGNAFAAFAVITAGIGLPLVVQLHHGNPAILAAIGMFSGYCGTLMTPMAANYNIVSAALLDLPDKNAVIKAQIPVAIPLLAINIVLMYLLVYHF
jgi:uncharacterized membrane protein